MQRVSPPVLIMSKNKKLLTGFDCLKMSNFHQRLRQNYMNKKSGQLCAIFLFYDAISFLVIVLFL